MAMRVDKPIDYTSLTAVAPGWYEVCGVHGQDMADGIVEALKDEHGFVARARYVGGNGAESDRWSVEIKGPRLKRRR